MGYGITSINQIIDKATLHLKLTEIRSYVNAFGRAADEVEEAGEICVPEAFCIDGNALHDPLLQLAEEMRQQQQEFNNYLDNLEEAANYVYDVQYNEYVEYQREQDRLKREREAQLQAQQAQEQAKAGKASN